jgi:hypothetical protein
MMNHFTKSFAGIVALARGTTERAISITRQAVEGLASWSLRAAA